MQTVYTIGHSNHDEERFLDLLCLHGITAVGDVRSRPYSRMYQQYNREALKRVLKTRDLEYVFMGKEFGARSEDPACYRDGKVQYDRLMQTELFQQGVVRLRDGLTEYRIALMCAEKEPLECHRTILVSRHLSDIGFDVQHIHADGRLESHGDAVQRLKQMLHLPDCDLFRSPDEIVADAYKLQEERIAFEVATE